MYGITLHVGDRVRIDPEVDPTFAQKYPGVWVIEKVNPKTIIAKPLGGGRGLRAYPSLFRLDDGSMPAAPNIDPVLSRTEVFWPGNLVRSKTMPGLWIVIADKGDKVNIVKFGGDGGRYWRVPPASLIPETPAGVRAKLLGES